uniref:C2H2-type domain-containing protein n=1 Tax=Graphocephala atropunctata TaxID=36148 RepID=A0A1B6M1T2_9HEMI
MESSVTTKFEKVKIEPLVATKIEEVQPFEEIYVNDGDYHSYLRHEGDPPQQHSPRSSSLPFPNPLPRSALHPIQKFFPKPPHKPLPQPLPEQKTVQCANCSLTFATTSELLLHVKYEHCNLKVQPGLLYKCVKCGSKFIDAVKWRMHLKHECPPDVWCGFCSKKFYSKAELQSHCVQDHPNIKNLYSTY